MRAHSQGTTSQASSLEGQHFSIHMEIKTCNRKKICLVGSLQEHCDQICGCCKNKELWHQDIYNNQLPSLPLAFSQFSCSIMSDSLRPRELQHARPPCPSLTHRVHPNSCPLSRWCHPAISSSVIPFSSCPQSLPASGSFPTSQFFTSCGQSIGVSASASVLSRNTEDWSPLGWTGWISLQSKGLSKSLLQHHSSKPSILQRSAFFTIQLSHPHMTTGKTIALTRWTFMGKVMSLLFNMLSRLVITFLPRSKHLLISWLRSPSAVILEPKK